MPPVFDESERTAAGDTRTIFFTRAGNSMAYSVARNAPYEWPMRVIRSTASIRRILSMSATCSLIPNALSSAIMFSLTGMVDFPHPRWL